MAQEFPQSIGPYRVVRELGKGASGTVYLARLPVPQDTRLPLGPPADQDLGVAVQLPKEPLRLPLEPPADLAIKVLAPELTRDPELVARFRREGLIAAKLRHPNIVRVHDFCAQDGLYYMVMDYVGSDTLRDFLQALEQPLEQAEAIRLCQELLSALESAHAQGVVHRDVKPANILLNAQGQAVLSDFSIASAQEAQRLTQTGTMIGTPDYMAPEQFEAGSVDHRCDLYAVGAIAYELLTGNRPFQGDTIVQVMRAHLMDAAEYPHLVDAKIPTQLSHWVMRALEKNPQDRFASASEMLAALTACSGALPRLEPSRPKLSSTPAPTPVERPASASITKARAALEEVGEDFRSGFRTLAWTRFSLNGMPKIILWLAITFGLSRPEFKLLGAKAQLATYQDLWCLSWLLGNGFLSLMVLIRWLRQERIYRQIVAWLWCLLGWALWVSLLSQPLTQLGQPTKNYLERLLQGP